MNDLSNRAASVAEISGPIVYGIDQDSPGEGWPVFIPGDLAATKANSVISHILAEGCRRAGTIPEMNGAVLHLDTYGRPLRDWED
jgi:hypothetical protein